MPFVISNIIMGLITLIFLIPLVSFCIYKVTNSVKAGIGTAIGYYGLSISVMVLPSEYILVGALFSLLFSFIPHFFFRKQRQEKS